MRWSTFAYNFRWSDYVWLLNGRIAKLAIAVPLVGYLLLFNDFVAQFISFERLTPGEELYHGLSATARLRLLYIGLVFLGIANAAYFAFRPFVLRTGENRREYVNNSFEQFTATEYIGIHGTTRHEGHVTLYGKYYDAEYDSFLQQSIGDGRSYSQVDWGAAKSRFENLLRGMLMEHYFRYDSSRRGRLLICLTIAAIGYACVAIPSVDLFIKVVRVVIKPLGLHF
jgi:membrane protein implicated in regulation of membrane protease activity